MKQNPIRSIPKIDSELSLEGPKDSFIEDIKTNEQLIKKRIPSKALQQKETKIGRYTKTRVKLLYIKGIVKEELVQDTWKKLENIIIDGVLDSSYLKRYLTEQFNIFPTIIATERPDKSSMALLEGKIVILVDNSPYALILPNFFQDFLHTTDDYYQKSFNTTFIRIIRLLAFIIAIYTPAIYISVTTRDYDLIPLPLLYTLKAGRSYVPFPAYIEAFFMITCFEILKESDLRMSTTTGSSISILGGLILGDAAVAAGIVSPIMIIVIAISSISGLIFQSIELGNALRIYKILFLILSTIFGIIGVGIGSILLISNLLKTKNMGFPYISLNNEMKNDFIIKKNTYKRNESLTNNRIRGR